MARVYATAVDLAAYPGGDAVAAEDADTLLRMASRVVDHLLIGHVYDVDEDKLPTEVDVIDALRDATCAIALEADATGVLTAGASEAWQSVGIGSVSLSGRTLSEGARVVAGMPVPAAALLALADVGTLTVWVGSR